MVMRFLTALPVYNEAAHVMPVLDEVLRYGPEVLVVDDGSSDGTRALLAGRSDIRLAVHERNEGYGAALRTAFDYAVRHGYEVLVTIDCDGQHVPKLIPQFVAACSEPGIDIVSGSRYLKSFPGDTPPPEERRRINLQITRELNQCLGLRLTDAFCGFKAYRTEALSRLRLTDPGYAMPLELWVQAVDAGLTIVELPVPLIYLEEERSFGGAIDDAQRRLDYYHDVLRRSLQATRSTGGRLRGRWLSAEGCGQC